MNTKVALLLVSISFAVFSLFIPDSAHAQYELDCPTTPPCYNWDNPPALGCYLECVLPSIWTAFAIVIAGIAIVLITWLVFKTITAYGGANSQGMEETLKRWPYTILLAIIAVGAAGTILNILLKWLGFPVFDYWLTKVSEFLEVLKHTYGPFGRH